MCSNKEIPQELLSGDFYPAYLIMECMQVIAKRNDDEQYIWESTTVDTFTIMPNTINPPLGCGMEIEYLERRGNHEEAFRIHLLSCPTGCQEGTFH